MFAISFPILCSQPYLQDKTFPISMTEESTEETQKGNGFKASLLLVQYQVQQSAQVDQVVSLQKF